MVDRVDKLTRHRIMSANRGINTGPEIEVRKALFHKGFRYRLHVQNLPGKPDIVLQSWNVIIFVHGCFWHGHCCRRKPHSKSNKRFWADKIERNRIRDIQVRNRLLKNGWRVLTVWECVIWRRSSPFITSDEFRKVSSWIKGTGLHAELTEEGFKEI